MGEAVKLTRREMNRLVEIGSGRFLNFGTCKASNRSLERMGLIIERGGHKSGAGRVVWHGNAYLTDAGRSLLAGFPDLAYESGE